jgi:hypothetical protein
MVWGGLLRSVAKRNAVRSYVTRLPRLLVKDYGRSETYTPAQVSRTIARYKLNADYECYAIAAFSGPDHFAAHHDALGQTCDYAAMRTELAAAHFHGNTQFSISDMPGHFLQGMSGDSGFSDAGGHRGGGGSDGGGGHHG